MADVWASIERAAALHRQAVATAEAAARALDSYAPSGAPAQHHAEQQELATRLRVTAAELAPGWLGAPLDTAPYGGPLPAPVALAGHVEPPRYVRLGLAQPVDGARFPVVVPLLGAGHLAIDVDARDRRAAGLLGSLLLRLVAATPPGALQIRAVDATGAVFAPFRELASAGLMAAPATDGAGLRDLLAEAEAWIREPGEHTMLLVVAGLPEPTDDADLNRIAGLARSGAAHRLHLIVAGWPRPLDSATRVTLGEVYALVGDPPGASFGTSGTLNSPVYLDGYPPIESIQQVCAQVATAAAARGSTLAGLLPRRLWRESSAAGLAVTVGIAGDTPLTLRIAGLTPHWLIGGGVDGGASAFLTDVLYGLSTRYAPGELLLYLLDFTGSASGLMYRSWLPHIAAMGVRPDREYGLAVLRELDAVLARRAAIEAPVAEAPVAESSIPETPVPARIVCVIEEFEILVRGTDRIAREALVLLDSLARRGRSYGIHLILSTASLSGLKSLYAKRDSLLGQFPVRIALAGGGDVLDSRNLAAAPLAPGQAVVNTAGGLGGPSGASRAHERVVAFPDPLADPALLADLRERLHAADPALHASVIFDGCAAPRPPATLSAGAYPIACLGREIEASLPLATFPFAPDPTHHLAVLGPSGLAAGILESAVRSLAAQHAPGSVGFVLASFAGAQDSVAERLDRHLRAAGQYSTVVDAAGLKDVVADTSLTNTYLVGLGLDGAPDTGMGAQLARWPARHVHLLGWWRGLRRFREDGGAAMAGLVVLNLPAADAAALLDDGELAWQPRPNRALFHDRRTRRTVLIAPFVHSGHTP